LFLAEHFCQEDRTVYTDNEKTTIYNDLRQSDWKAFQRLLHPAVWTQAALRAAVSLGQGPLNLGNLLFFAIGAAWYHTKNFAEVLQVVLKLIRDSEDWPHSLVFQQQRRGELKAQRSQRHPKDPHGQDPTRVSEEAFVQARKKMPMSFWVALFTILIENFEAAHGQRVRWKGFRLLALDGTHIALDHWKRLEDHFGTAKNGQGKRTQARLVMLQFPQVRLPWRYELTAWTEAERTVAARLLDSLCARDLVLMDRGFWSYGLFWQIQHQHAYFATRRMAGVRWKTLRKLGADERIVRHSPSDWGKKWKKQELPKSIDLRVIEYQIRGFRKSAVVTNLLDAQAVSAEEWIRIATVDEAGQVLEPGLYHRRWEIETTFMELKVTQGLEGNLRSRTAEGIHYEVAGHVLLYLLTRWLMVEAAEKAGIDDPLRVSFKAALEELADLRETLVHAQPDHVRRVLFPRLLERIASHLVPFRPGRHYPRPSDGKPKRARKRRSRKTSKLKQKRAPKKITMKQMPEKITGKQTA
jgi:hypothetical protein